MKNRLGTQTRYIDFIAQSGGASYFKGKRGRGGGIFGLLKSIINPKAIAKAIIPMAKSAAKKAAVRYAPKVIDKGAHIIRNIMDDKPILKDVMVPATAVPRRPRKKVAKQQPKRNKTFKKKKKMHGGMKFTNPRKSTGIKRKTSVDIFDR